MTQKYEVWGAFELNGYSFKSYIPEDRETFVSGGWKLEITNIDKGELVRVEYIPMTHEPRFGADVSDVNALDDRVEAIIKEMRLEDDGGPEEESEEIQGPF